MDLRDKLEKAGYVMFETEDDNLELSLLKDVVVTNDSRLWHMFPAILANAMKNNKQMLSHLLKEFQNKKGHDRLNQLLYLSYLVYVQVQEMKNSESMNSLNKLVNRLKHGKNVMKQYDTEKAVELFRLYYKRDSEKVKQLMPMVTDNRLEYALSEIFTGKQKDLVLRKFKGEKLGKTDNEYYSRVVKKKLLALANEDLHKMALLIVNKK